ncbi:S26 family signal peptidase [Photobacterium sp. ZSDE20]|uniref:S26 family signal peptidase n=1 Tax=Photobacterium pectinilyticum TaxID=2906793 RepID=A0ABT1N6A3_9GAMM|nr:S26 family signal peptidase [Photobacterium sp. ZSDE20]MCQ1060275.1 S26 family signal peptidase [Photobacterium sp. ZSDE20]MDD1826262.1 S26 family signal peptidase [Photobacterium sp. ZSDE20]
MESYGYRPSAVRDRVLKPATAAVALLVLFLAFTANHKIIYAKFKHGCLGATLYLVNYAKHDYSYGDIVTISSDGVPLFPEGLQLTKMVAGMPGDTITFDGTVVRNLTNGFEKFVPLGEHYDELKAKHDLATEWSLGDGEIFLIGDQEHSIDSRIVGAASIDFVLGKTYAIL